MELAYAKDWDKAISLLDRRHERFGNRSLLNIAYSGNLKPFIANTPCHDAVKAIWQRGFATNSEEPCHQYHFQRQKNLVFYIMSMIMIKWSYYESHGSVNHW